MLCPPTVSRFVPRCGHGVYGFLRRERVCNFAGGVDEKLRGGAERTSFHGDDADRHSSQRQFDRQHLDVLMRCGKAQHGLRENGEVAIGRQQAHPHRSNPAAATMAFQQFASSKRGHRLRAALPVFAVNMPQIEYAAASLTDHQISRHIQAGGAVTSPNVYVASKRGCTTYL